jgi:hypothetical protein
MAARAQLSLPAPVKGNSRLDPCVYMWTRQPAASTMVGIVTTKRNSVVPLAKPETAPRHANSRPTSDNRGGSGPGASSKAEEFLRDEIRHTADVMLKLVQWGITVEIAVSTLIFYARREIRSDPFLAHLPSGALLPWRVHIIGTAFLTMIAIMFTVLLFLVQRRRMYYRQKLYRLPNKLIDEIEPTKYGNWIYPLMFATFPAFDLAIRAYYILFITG